MILLLYKFLKREQRAPTARETKAIAAGFVGVFWLYNIVGIGIGMLFSSLNDPTLWPYIFSLLKQPMFLLMASLMIVALSVPLYLITWWFYGPQAKRMAKHMGIQA